MEAKQVIHFIEAVIGNPDHVAYTLGLRQNAALQYYAVNVALLHAVTPDLFVETASKLYPDQYKAVVNVAEKCEKLAGQLGVKIEEVTNVRMFEAMIGGAKAITEAKPEPVTEASMMVKCPECGKEFSATPKAA